MTGRWVYLAGRHGARGYIKVGSTIDLVRRRRSITEDRTRAPLACQHRQTVILAAWPETDGPTEAALLATLADARWTQPGGRRSEYVTTTRPEVTALLAERCPDWRTVLAHDPDQLRPIRLDHTGDDDGPALSGSGAQDVRVRVSDQRRTE